MASESEPFCTHTPQAMSDRKDEVQATAEPVCEQCEKPMSQCDEPEEFTPRTKPDAQPCEYNDLGHCYICEKDHVRPEAQTGELQWMGVEDRLPPEGTWVLVCYNRDEVEQAYMQERRWFLARTDSYDDQIEVFPTEWMAMPKSRLAAQQPTDAQGHSAFLDQFADDDEALQIFMAGWHAALEAQQGGRR